MGTPAATKSVRTVIFLPAEVADWIEQKAASAFKKSSQFQRDHWVALYNKAKEAKPDG